MPDVTPEKTACQKIRDLREAHLPYWQELRKAMDEEEAFLDGDRYEDDQGPYNKDRRLIQIRGQEISDTVRHIAAQSTVRPRNVETRPIDRDDDPEAGEVAASLVQMELSNPWKGFDDEYEAAIIAARERRLGIVWMDYEPDFGQFGELFYSFEDPKHFMWDEAYDPHHPLCGWLLREKRIDVDKARKMYNAPWLEPDRKSAGKETRADRPVSRGATQHGPELSMIDDNRVTIWECWYKNDKSKRYREKDYRKLKPAEQYMSCTDGCGERSDPLAGLPESVPGGCPTCGGDMERIDAVAVDETLLKHENGKRMVAMAPYCRNPEGDAPLYDGKWPIPRARSFPALFITAYIKPGRPVGPSDTTLMWDQQIASDNLRTAALQRVLEHRNYWFLPRVGVVDYRGNRFEFRDDQFNVGFIDQSKSDMGQLQVQNINSTGLDPAFSQVFGITQQALTQYRGVADFGFTPESSKDIAASTVQQLTAQGEIPTEHFNRRKNRALGKFYGVVWDYIQATYTPQRISRLNLDGADILANIVPDDLPNFDFVITDSEPFTGIEKQKAESAKQLAGMMQALPDMWDLLAELQGFSPSIIRKFQKRQADLEEKAAIMPPPPGMDGQTPDGLPPPDQGMGADSGAGMDPALNSPNGAEVMQ